MDCDVEKLRTIMLDAVADETGLAGVPFRLVEQRIKEQARIQGMDCDDSHIQDIINKALDEWTVDKTLDELSDERMRELGLPEIGDFIWHLKVLTKQKTAFYESLRPEEKALIRLLRNQNDAGHLGEIPKQEAIRILKEQGLIEHLEYIHVEDTIDDFMTRWGSESNVWCYGLVKEFEKTEEYKQWREEIDDQAAEKEMRRYRFTEECETTDPIYGRLDQLADRQCEDLDALEMKRESMDEDEYLRRKRDIETRDTHEESQWEQIIEMIYELPFDILIDLRNLLWKEMRTPDFILEFLERKSKEKKSA